MSVLIPVCGYDPEQTANFASLCAQDYPEYQLIFGALDPNDPALVTVRSVLKGYPECDAQSVSGGECFGANRKVCNLYNLSLEARHEMLVLCDSDMRVGPAYLRQIVQPFADRAVGLVTCPYRGAEVRGLASALEALGIGADFIPSVLLTWRFWGMSFAFGSTIVIRRESLEALGGFVSLADELADDYLLGNRVYASGKRVALSDYVVDDVLGRESMREMWLRRLRWGRTARAMQPGPYSGLFITYGTAVAVALAVISRGAPFAWALLGVTLALRLATALAISTFYTRDPNPARFWYLLPISDLLSFCLWAASLLGRSVSWRGKRYRVRRGGRLTPV